MPKFTYTYSEPLSLETTANNRAEAEARLERFNQKLIELAHEMHFMLKKGDRIKCDEGV
jgi:hypothetical protein